MPAIVMLVLQAVFELAQIEIVALEILADAFLYTPLAHHRIQRALRGRWTQAGMPMPR